MEKDRMNEMYLAWMKSNDIDVEGIRKNALTVKEKKKGFFCCKITRIKCQR